MKLFSKYTLTHIRYTTVRMFQNMSLIWLNANENTPDHQNTLAQLRRTVHSIQTFTDRTKCIEFLENIHDKKACMIISGSASQQIVPQIHNLDQLDTIFIFCRDKQFHEIWTKNWSKIKGVFNEIEPICDALKKTNQQWEQDSIPMSFIKSPDVSSKEEIKHSFMYPIALNEIFLTTKFNDQQIQEFIDYARDVFKDNEQELININKFEQERTKHSPIWWYTNECFLSRMLNRGLRLLDGDILVKMGFFTADLHRQIEELHTEQFRSRQSNAESKFIVYRGQRMDKTQFDKLQQTKGGLLSFNNFLCTTKNREISMNFAHESISNSENVGILFVMTIPTDQPTIPFASISDISNHGINQDEVLFTMPSIFHVNDIQPLSDYPGVFQIDLTLSTTNDKDLHQLIYQTRRAIFSDYSTWSPLLLMLEQKGLLSKHDAIERIKAHLNHQLAYIRFYMKQYKEAIHHYETALRLRQQLFPPNHIESASLYYQIGLVYHNMGEYMKALSNYDKALAIRLQSVAASPVNLALLYSSIGDVHRSMGEYAKALFYVEKALEIQQESLPANYLDLASSYYYIGKLYQSMGEDARALFNFEKAFEIEQQILPGNHGDVAVIYARFALIEETWKNYAKAVSFIEKSINIAQKMFSPNDPRQQEYKNILDRLKSKI